MLTRMILKMLLKACIPFAIVIGGASYMFYMKGGDPGAILAKVAGNAIVNAKDNASSATTSMGKLTPSLSNYEASPQQVYKWVDSNGVTHFSSAEPIETEAVSFTVNPNRNVVAATPTDELDEFDAQVAKKLREKDKNNLEALPDESLPGAAGMELPFQVDEETLNSLMKTVQGAQ
ncbi:MAG: DUF4124 domain-containing protein [Acidiferrobacterales bacterium]|nr:DUF4124 domain-containing protein [Acidiferrobacterales bacterium]